MITPQKEFLEESVLILERLLGELRKISHGILPPDYLHQVARVVHSIKGTAHTFDFKNLAVSSHNFETILQDIARGRIINPYQSRNLLAEGLTYLADLCRNKDNTGEENFPKKITYLEENLEDESADFLEKIPKRFLREISASELGNLQNAFAHGKKFYIIKSHYHLREFAEKFKKIHDFLSNRGRIIAFVAFNYEENNSQKGFKSYFATDLRFDELAEGLKVFDSEIEFEFDPHLNFKERLKKVFRHITKDCRKSLAALNKKTAINIKISADYISPRNFVIIRDAAIHLLHNAIDHGIELPTKRLAANKPAAGKITLTITERAENIIIKITDDGNGIDAEKVKLQALKAKLISKNQLLTLDETLDFIFQPNFSTASKVTDLSGRGVGLNAVKQTVESIGGNIRVESRSGLETIFSITLPRV